MTSCRRGFTLIELLVVIAIIAILAAILFPVFAAARENARKNNCLSNVKQIGTSIIMYTQDFDENFPTFTSYCDSARVDNPLDPSGPTKPRPMWQWKVSPYIKNWQIFTCPSDSNATSNDPVFNFYNLSYGYNYGYLSKLEPGADPGGCAEAPYYFSSHSLSTVQRAAEIVMVAESGGKAITSAIPVGSMVNPPDAWNSDQYFFAAPPNGEQGWGLNCQTWFAGSKWGDTDGFAWRHMDGGNVVLTDGHAKFFKPRDLAVGTNYDPNQACSSTVVTDPTRYMWDPRY